MLVISKKMIEEKSRSRIAVVGAGISFIFLDFLEPLKVRFLTIVVELPKRINF